MYRRINATTMMNDASGTPALTASMIIEGRSALDMPDSVVPKPRSGKLTLKAIADRKFGNLAIIQKLNDRGYSYWQLARRPIRLRGAGGFVANRWACVSKAVAFSPMTRPGWQAGAGEFR
jgi:hypothetical protein